MIVKNKCEHCKKDEVIGYSCEVCSKITSNKIITISFGFGHPLDSEEFHFCGDKCLMTFFQEEKEKEK